MIWDIHAHLAGVGTGDTGNYLAPRFRESRSFRRSLRRLGFTPAILATPDADQRLASAVIDEVNASWVDRVVLLALDAAYHDNGTRDDARTLLVTDNDFVADLAEAHEKILFGASIHPARPDALAELDRLVARGACLVKWLPGAQNIEPDHPRCFPFYDALARHGLPLLCHTGPEHTLKAFPNALNDPLRLAPALERGVTVIAAHCGTRLYLHERSGFPSWRTLALRHERCYGDLSAFGVITRMATIRALRKQPALLARCVFGSDYPAVPLPLSCVGSIGLGAALRIQLLRNRFDQSIELLQAAGVPTDVFTRATQLLRIPATKRAALAVVPPAP